MEKLKRNAGGECYFTAACENKAQKKAMPKAPGVPQWEASVHGLSAARAAGGLARAGNAPHAWGRRSIKMPNLRTRRNTPTSVEKTYAILFGHDKC